MVSALDILYIVLALCSIVLTVVIVIFLLEATGAVREVRSISQNIEHITVLIERISQIAFPGIEKAAKSADFLGTKVAGFLKKKSDWFK